MVPRRLSLRTSKHKDVRRSRRQLAATASPVQAFTQERHHGHTSPLKDSSGDGNPSQATRGGHERLGSIRPYDRATDSIYHEWIMLEKVSFQIYHIRTKLVDERKRLAEWQEKLHERKAKLFIRAKNFPCKVHGMAESTLPVASENMRRRGCSTTNQPQKDETDEKLSQEDAKKRSVETISNLTGGEKLWEMIRLAPDRIARARASDLASDDAREWTDIFEDWLEQDKLYSKMVEAHKSLALMQVVLKARDLELDKEEQNMIAADFVRQGNSPSQVPIEKIRHQGRRTGQPGDKDTFSEFCRSEHGRQDSKSVQYSTLSTVVLG